MLQVLTRYKPLDCKQRYKYMSNMFNGALGLLIRTLNLWTVSMVEDTSLCFAGEKR
jgi:hypothetical protein